MAKLRIVVLHGSGNNSSSMREHIAPLLARLSPLATFTFLDATAPIEFTPDEYFPAPPREGQPLSWFDISSKEGSLVCDRVEEALAVLRDADDAEARARGSGFDCVMGFSQGGALATLALALARSPAEGAPAAPLRSLRCAMLFSAPHVWVDRVFTYARLFPPAVEKFALPSFHCIGKADSMVPPARSVLLANDCFVSPCIHEHESGHRVPDDEGSLDACEAWVKAQCSL
ncbi:hypothetical protein AB1Y20_002977 [Prymnesium parvum]|uniref:Serine hydrolase domain-containing protein n=1 Tax=Prymnesium parvum TaxID=97485 RepID=A0AB34JAM0_PRYPA